MLWRPVKGNGRCRKYSVERKQLQTQTEAKCTQEYLQGNWSSSNDQESIPTRSVISAAGIGMLNIQNCVLPEASSSNQVLGISAQKKRRRHVIESSEEDD